MGNVGDCFDTLSAAARALGAAGINIDGLSGPSIVDDRLVRHLLVEDAAAATKALEGANIAIVREQDVPVVDIEDRPGALADLYDRAGFTRVDFANLTTGGQIVIGAEQRDQARQRLALL